MENKPVTPAAQALAPAVSEIRALLETSRKNIAQQVNQELLSTYWKIGEVIVRYEQNDSVRAAYGEKRPCCSFQKRLPRNWARAFRARMFTICGSSISAIQFSRQCLEN